MVLYEAQRAHFPLVTVLILASATAAFLVLAVYCFTHRKNAVLSARICFTVITVLLAGETLIVALGSYPKTQEIYELYEKGAYETVSGTIDGYIVDENGRVDEFEVAGIPFYAYGEAPTFGYGYPCRTDGGILENGQNVTVYFIHYQFENVIMKIVLEE